MVRLFNRDEANINRGDFCRYGYSKHTILRGITFLPAYIANRKHNIGQASSVVLRKPSWLVMLLGPHNIPGTYHLYSA